ncbi:MAG: hypothetical protein ACFCGT_06735 [Sandaracinaceae bacterium]
MTDLPLPKSDLPEKIQRFGDPNAPEPARAMAARGLVPVKGEDLVTLLVQLSADRVDSIAESARATLGKVPEGALAAAVSAPLHPAILGALRPFVDTRRKLLEALAVNRATPVEVTAAIALSADERTCERIATDQERLLENPSIIEALYKNRNTRMSTVDRLVELAARNQVELTGVATFEAHVQAIQGQLIPEPTEDPLPSDESFQVALARDGDDDAIERDKVDGSEEVKEDYRPLAMQIYDMSNPEKVRLSLIGNAAARAILVRDANRIVAMAAVSSPAMTDAEAAKVAASKQVSEDVLRYVSNKREWLGRYEVKRNLVFNSKTPLGQSMKFLSHLRLNDLRALARSRNVQAALRTAARNRLNKRTGA